jgi:SAM-dependent methyltransferase
VIGTDVSIKSLEVCRRNADQLGIKNLKLEEQSLNLITYEEELDYIVCTGVIHHNADPQYTLSKLAGALKPNGVRELMVYNYYHRLFTTAAQKAIRALSKSPLDLGLQHKMMKKLIQNFPMPCVMADFLAEFENQKDAEMADSLLQPVEYSYTVETLGNLLESCGLEYMTYCVNDFGISENYISWNIDFQDEEMRAIYSSLLDAQRWQIMLSRASAPNFSLSRSPNRFQILLPMVR